MPWYEEKQPYSGMATSASGTAALCPEPSLTAVITLSSAALVAATTADTTTDCNFSGVAFRSRSGIVGMSEESLSCADCCVPPRAIEPRVKPWPVAAPVPSWVFSSAHPQNIGTDSCTRVQLLLLCSWAYDLPAFMCHLGLLVDRL